MSCSPRPAPSVPSWSASPSAEPSRPTTPSNTATGSVYVNFLDHDDGPRTPDAFSAPAWERLLELRRRYDPDGVFDRAGAITGRR